LKRYRWSENEAIFNLLNFKVPRETDTVNEPRAETTDFDVPTETAIDVPTETAIDVPTETEIDVPTETETR